MGRSLWHYFAGWKILHGDHILSYSNNQNSQTNLYTVFTGLVALGELLVSCKSGMHNLGIKLVGS